MTPESRAGSNPVASVADSSEAFHALGSDVRMRILQALTQGEQNVAELAKATDLHPATVRYHVGILLQDGIIERATLRREGRVGRPTSRYRLRKERLIAGFPPRKYEVLAETLLGVLDDSVPAERWRAALKQAGRESGRRVIQALAEKAKIEEWSPREFVRQFLNGYMAEEGVSAQVVEIGDDFVQYRSNVCPFQELAAKYPERVCDNLDMGFHEGVGDAMGDVRVERLACLGHGSPYCEYALQWKKRGRREKK